MPALTYRQLRDRLNFFTPEQLDMPVMYGDPNECTSGLVGELEIMAEDQVNPSGEGWENVSTCGLDQADLADEEIVARKGQPVLQVVSTDEE